MSYVKQEYESGETLYASQLNAMDDQIASNEEAISALSETVSGMDTVSDSARTLLLAILRNGTYLSDQSENIDALETELGVGAQEDALTLIAGNIGAYTDENKTTLMKEALVMISGYDADAMTTSFSGHTLERVTLSFASTGTLSIGRAALDSFGSAYPTVQDKQEIVISQTGEVTFDITPIAVGEHETIVLGGLSSDGLTLDLGRDGEGELLGMEVISQWNYSSKTYDQITSNRFVFGAFYGR